MFKFIKRKKKPENKVSTETESTENLKELEGQKQEYSNSPKSQSVKVDEAVDQNAKQQTLRERLKKSRQVLGGKLASLFKIKKTIDDDLLEEIETDLLMADIGVAATTEIIDQLTASLKRKQLKDPQALYTSLKQQLQALLKPAAVPLVLGNNKPFVILMVGINGAGKTTTIGKLAKRFKSEGKSVMLAAGDTFRAAAVEQLQSWGERHDVSVVAQHTGADSASVIFDALQSAQAKNMDVLIADTAGRLHTQSNLMDELSKVKRVMSKLDGNAPHEVMLVIDGSTGQNAINQARQFNQSVGITGMTITKLDGTAKGGVVFALAREMKLPVRFIGVGEKAEDLRNFDPEEFTDAILPSLDESH
ncbi:MAG: signal recognition particle-docking protein FtsY [bacterium]